MASPSLQLLATGVPIVGVDTTGVDTSPVVAGPDSSGNDSSGWLSGLGDLFSSVASGVSTGLRAANFPNVPSAGSGWVFNPATNSYVNPITGQSLTSTGTLTSAGLGTAFGQSGLLTILLIGALIFLFLRKPSG